MTRTRATSRNAATVGAGLDMRGTLPAHAGLNHRFPTFRGSRVSRMARSMAISVAIAPDGTRRVPHPLAWVLTSYLAMGLVYVTVGSLANVMFKNLGLSNEQATFWSSMLGLPYVLKPLWAPLLELS